MNVDLLFGNETYGVQNDDDAAWAINFEDLIYYNFKVQYDHEYVCHVDYTDEVLCKVYT